MGLIRAALAALALALASAAPAQERFITVASTTSTEQSGLFKHLLPIFTAKTGIAVRVVAVGTGQALDIGPYRLRTSAMACAAMASPRPMASTPSLVLPLMLTRLTSMPIAAATLARMAST